MHRKSILKPLLFEPGSKYPHEEHSAYSLLALIFKKKTQLPFAQAIEQLVFKPLQLANSGVDDDLLALGPLTQSAIADLSIRFLPGFRVSVVRLVFRTR